MDLYLIRCPSAWANMQELEAAGAKSAKVGNDEMSDHQILNSGRSLISPPKGGGRSQL